MLIFVISDDWISFVKIYPATNVKQLAKLNKINKQDFFLIDFSWLNETFLQKN